MRSKLKSGKPKGTLPKTVWDMRGDYIGGQPFNTGAVEIENPLNPEQKLVVFRSFRADPLAAMHDARQVDEAQYTAGRHWQKAYELAEIGGARGIDTTREYVDGGQIPQNTISEAQKRAFKDLAKARTELGAYGSSLIYDVLACHMTVRDSATRRMMSSEAEFKFVGRRFRECLDTLAVVYGYATRV